MKKAIIYTRVSTDEQANNYSLPHQEEQLRKYCAIKGIEIVKHFQEDFSAKTFERPEFKILFEYAKKNKGNIDYLLILKWDRFSRNLSEGTTKVKEFERLRIEVNAIEQWIDHTIPESLTMLAVYLASPEVENLRRGLNTASGMRRALKEGRWPNKAPLGYKNTRVAKNKTFIEPTPKAHLIKMAFEKMATGLFKVEELRKEMAKLGLKLSRNGFYKMLRNGLYAGLIRVPAYKDEPEEVVEGVHEPIIDKELFYTVKGVLDGRTRHTIKITKTRPYFPLRGHLICQKCDGNITASVSRGNGGRYFYYHCQNSKCKNRFRGDIANDSFLSFLGRIELKPEVAELYTLIIQDVFTTNDKEQFEEVKKIKSQLLEVENRIKSADDKFVDGDIDKEAYDRIIKKQKEDKAGLTTRLNHYNTTDTGLVEYAKYGFTLLSNLRLAYSSIDTATKQKLVGSIFPNKLIFENEKYRTNGITEIQSLLFNGIGQIEKPKMKKALISESFSPSVARRGIEPLLPE